MKTTNPFYRSGAWQKCRGLALRRDKRLCQRCFKRGKLTAADMVHHIRTLEERPDLALDLDNLESLCNTCHNQMHPEKGRGKSGKEQPMRRAAVVRASANEEVT